MNEGFVFLLDAYKYNAERGLIKYTPLDFCNHTLED